MINERKTITLWITISVLLPLLLFAAMSRANASTNEKPAHTSLHDPQPHDAQLVHSQFTGVIDAIYEKRYLKIVSKESVAFTVDTDAIQRITYTSNEKYKGLVVYPLEQKVMFFRRSGPLKFYTVLPLGEYDALMAEHITEGTIDEHDRIGFSTHFLHLKNTSKIPAPGDEPVTHDGQRCDKNAWKIENKTSDSLFVAEHCQHIAIPRAWLHYTDLNIPAEITGFPYKFVKHVTDNTTSSTSVFDGLGVDKVISKESTAGKFVDVAGKTLRKAVRAADEMEEFTYQVVKLVPGPVKKTSFIDLVDFVRVNSLKELKESFPDHPDYRDSSTIDNSSSSHGSSGMSDLFD